MHTHLHTMQHTHSLIHNAHTYLHTMHTHLYAMHTYNAHILTHNAHTQNDSFLRDCGIKTVLKVYIGGPSPSVRGPPKKEKKVCMTTVSVRAAR